MSLNAISSSHSTFIPYVDAGPAGATTTPVSLAEPPGILRRTSADLTTPHTEIEKENRSPSVPPTGLKFSFGKKLGGGSFGTVYVVTDQNGKHYAAKTSRPDRRDMPDFHRINQIREQQMVEELNIAEEFLALKFGGLKYPLIVKCITGFPLGKGHCTIYELLSINLYQYMEKEPGQHLSLSKTRKVALQLFRALYFLTTVKVVHGDLKPENILLVDPKEIRIRVGDWGYAFCVGKLHYPTLQTRNYRSPEMAMGFSPPTPAIDMWSVGCTLAELYTGDLLFPIKNHADGDRELLLRMGHLLGPVPKEMQSKCTFFRHHLFLEQMNAFLPKSFCFKPNEYLSRSQREKQIPLADLLGKIFDFEPTTRISPADALGHPFITPQLTTTDDIAGPPPEAVAGPPPEAVAGPPPEASV